MWKSQLSLFHWMFLNKKSNCWILQNASSWRWSSCYGNDYMWIILNYPCIGLNPTWSWCIILSMHCLILFVNTLLRISESILAIFCTIFVKFGYRWILTVLVNYIFLKIIYVIQIFRKFLWEEASYTRFNLTLLSSTHVSNS